MRSVVIPHGVPPEFRTIGNAPSPFAFPYFLYVSSFFEYKAQLEVIEAWQIYRQAHPGPEKLVLLGYDKTAYGQKVRQRISDLRLEEQVLMLSAVPYPTLPSYYQHAKALLFASSCENCPNILLESLSSGVPVLSSQYPPMPEFAQDGALYFDPYQPQQISQQLLAITKQPDEAKKLGERGRQIASIFTIEKTVSETWNSVLDVLRS